MEGGIFLCHWYFLLKAYLRKRKLPGPASQEDPAEMSKIEERADSGLELSHRDIPLNPIIFSQTSHSEV